MSKLLKVLFLLAGIIDVLLGAALLALPGRFLGLIYWEPVDPLLSRLFGAALLAMAWTSIYALRANDRAKATVLTQMQAIFSGLGALGFLRHLVAYPYYPPVIWGIFILLVVSTALWLWALIKK